MKVIIAGAGKVGCMLTKKLLAEGYEVTLIDNNQQVMEVCSDRFDVMSVQGNCASMEVLEQANFRNVRLEEGSCHDHVVYA